MSKNISAWLVTLCLLFTPICHAASEVEIGGLLLDSTKSRLGQAVFILIDAMAKTQYSQDSVDMAESGW